MRVPNGRYQPVPCLYLRPPRVSSYDVVPRENIIAASGEGGVNTLTAGRLIFLREASDITLGRAISLMRRGRWHTCYAL